jgi:sulfonate transport system substrate-binding protein
MNTLEKAVIAVGISLVVGLSALVFWPKPEVVVVDLRTVRIGRIGNFVSYAPFYVAKHQNKFEEAFGEYGYKVEYQTFEGGAEANTALLNDQVDVVFESDIVPAIIGKAEKLPIFIANVSGTYLEEIMIPTDSTIKTIEEMRDRKVIVKTGSSNHYNLRKALSVVGVNVNDYAITEMPIRAAIAAIKNQGVDAWAANSPYIELGELSHYMRPLPKGEAKAYSIIVVRDAFKAQKVKAFIDLMNIIDDTKAWIPFNEITAVTITANELEMPVEVIRKAFFRHNWGVKLDEAAVNIMQPFADFIREQKMIDDAVDIRLQLIRQNLD